MIRKSPIPGVVGLNGSKWRLYMGVTNHHSPPKPWTKKAFGHLKTLVIYHKHLFKCGFAGAMMLPKWDDPPSTAAAHAFFFLRHKVRPCEKRRVPSRGGRSTATGTVAPKDVRSCFFSEKWMAILMCSCPDVVYISWYISWKFPMNVLKKIWWTIWGSFWHFRILYGILGCF